MSPDGGGLGCLLRSLLGFVHLVHSHLFALVTVHLLLLGVHLALVGFELSMELRAEGVGCAKDAVGFIDGYVHGVLTLHLVELSGSGSPRSGSVSAHLKLSGSASISLSSLGKGLLVFECKESFAVGIFGCGQSSILGFRCANGLGERYAGVASSSHRCEPGSDGSISDGLSGVGCFQAAVGLALEGMPSVHGVERGVEVTLTGSTLTLGTGVRVSMHGV